MQISNVPIEVINTAAVVYDLAYNVRSHGDTRHSVKLWATHETDPNLRRTTRKGNPSQYLSWSGFKAFLDVVFSKCPDAIVRTAAYNTRTGRHGVTYNGQASYEAQRNDVRW